MSRRIAWIAVAIGLALVGLLVMPDVRRRWIASVITWDQPPSDAVSLPAASGAGLAPAARTRVILVDGLLASVANARDTMPAWNAACDRGTRTTIDVGFPTVSLPVEVALWTGLTQQQTGVVFRSDRPLEPPRTEGIPSRVAGSIAIAENHGYLVRSLGFTHVEPPAERANHAKDIADWAPRFRAAAREAVASASPLAFVHVLRVDTAGHKFGGASPAYAAAAREADAIVGEMVAAAPDARWFLLSDHGHVPQGGHGGEESFVRHTTACIVGPGLAARTGGTIHVVDVSRAIADSVGVPLDRASLGRPLDGALAAPLADGAGVPAMPLGRSLAALAVALAGLLGPFVLRRWWPASPRGGRPKADGLAVLVPLTAALALAIVRGWPSLSTPMIYPPSGRDMWLTWQPVLALGALFAAWRGRGAALALIGSAVALWIAAVTACPGGWSAVFGAQVAPITPYVTAWVSPLALIAAHALIYGAAALAASIVIGTWRRRGPSAAAPTPPREAAPATRATDAPPASDPP